MSEVDIQDRASAYYEQRYTGLGLRYHTEVIRWMMREAYGKVLDAGCGTGIVSTLYQDTRLKITGIDISPGMLAHHPGPYLQCSVNEMPFPDDHFDFVLCRSLLHHLPQPQVALQEMVRVLKPGGHFACWETNQAWLAQLVRKRTQHGDRFSEYHHAFTKHELVTTLSRYLTIDQVRYMGYLAYPLWGFPDILNIQKYVPCKNLLYSFTSQFDRWLELIPGIRRMAWALGVRAHK